MLTRIFALAICCLMLNACDEPTFIMAGSALNGGISEPPAKWHFDDEAGLAQLETNPDEPYSINLAYVQLNAQLYVYAGDTRTNWVKHIEQNPFVRIRVEDTIYPVQAVRVSDPNEFNEFAEIWANRSMFQRDPRKFEEVWLYRLEGR